MVEERREFGQGIILGGIGGALAGAGLTSLLTRAEEVKAAELPPDKKLDYLLECQTAIVVLLQQAME